MYDIGKVADTAVEVAGLMNCDVDTVWKKYLHPAVKEPALKFILRGFEI